MLALRQLTAELQSGVQGEVLTTGLERYHTDFGGVRRKAPALVVRATCEQDVVHTLRTARRAGVTVTVRGAGHSVNGQSLDEGGIVLENYLPGAQWRLLEDGAVEVTGRSRWRHLERALNAAGRQAPVLTDYLDLSVGGTLSVGGIGLNSIVSGFQADTVRRLRLIQPDGTALWCSPTEEAELFRFALGGLGQVGLIEKVVMETAPYRRFTHVFQRAHRGIREMLEFLPRLVQRGSGVQHFNGYVRSGQVVSEYGYFSDGASPEPGRLGEDLRGNEASHQAHADYPFRLQERRDQWLASFPDHLRLWTDYLFDWEGAARFMAYLEPRLAQPPFAQSLRAMYILVVRRPSRPTPFALVPAPPGELLYGMGTYTMVSRWQPALLARTMAAQREALEVCCALGGRPYLYGFNTLDDGLKERFYGADWPRLVELRQQRGLERMNPGSF